jgi:hypothetical protein
MAGGYKLYDYDPSKGAAVVFAIIFALTTFLHTFQMIRKRSWYFIPFVLGGLCKSGGISPFV